VLFATQITIAFGDTDPAGLVYFPNILHYCHIAMERLFAEHCNREYSTLIRDADLGFPTVRSDAEFMVPLVYGDTIRVEIETLVIGNSSVKLQYSMWRTADEVLCSRVQQVHVAMNLSSRRSTLIPPDIRRELERLVQRS